MSDKVSNERNQEQIQFHLWDLDHFRSSCTRFSIICIGDDVWRLLDHGKRIATSKALKELMQVAQQRKDASDDGDETMVNHRRLLNEIRDGHDGSRACVKLKAAMRVIIDDLYSELREMGNSPEAVTEDIKDFLTAVIRHSVRQEKKRA